MFHLRRKSLLRRREIPSCGDSTRLVAFHSPVYLVILSVVSSLNCFTCTSHASFQSCDIDARKESCGPATRCGKLSFKLPGIHRYRKGCISAVYCYDPDRYCRSIIDAEDCEISCCPQDLCNSATKNQVCGKMTTMLICTTLAVKAYSAILLYNSQFG